MEFVFVSFSTPCPPPSPYCQGVAGKAWYSSPFRECRLLIFLVFFLIFYSLLFQQNRDIARPRLLLFFCRAVWLAFTYVLGGSSSFPPLWRASPLVLFCFSDFSFEFSSALPSVECAASSSRDCSATSTIERPSLSHYLGRVFSVAHVCVSFSTALHRSIRPLILVSPVAYHP